MRLIIYLLNKCNTYFIICSLVLQPESKLFGVNRRKFPLVSYSDHCGDSAFTGNNSRVSIHFRTVRSAWFVSWEWDFIREAIKSKNFELLRPHICVCHVSHLKTRWPGPVLNQSHYSPDAETGEEAFFSRRYIIRMDKIQLQGSICSCKDVYFPHKPCFL